MGIRSRAKIHKIFCGGGQVPVARVPPGHWGAVRAPGRGASGVAGGRAERPGQRPRLCRAHRSTKCICVSPPLMPFSLSPAFRRRRRRPAAVSPPNRLRCAASGISTQTRPAGCFCVDALPHCGNAPPEPRSRNIGFPHCARPCGTRWEIRGRAHFGGLEFALSRRGAASVFHSCFKPTGAPILGG